MSKLDYARCARIACARRARRTGPLAVSALAVPALALALAACAASGGKPASVPGKPSGPMLGATFKGTFYLSTPTSHETRAFTDRIASVRNCAEAARTGWDGTFRVPTPQAPLPRADIQVAGFHGPGTYTPAMMRHDKADMILLTGKAGTSKYDITTALTARTPGKEVLFLSKDGSGQLVYSDAHLNGDPASPEVAGLIQWSCSS
jgi:hypothetical protein